MKRNPNLSLKRFGVEDVSVEYQDWLKNDDLIKYLDVSQKDRSREALEKWVRGYDHESKFLWKIMDTSNDRFIGTATLYNINHIHKNADFGYLIGNSDYWGGVHAYTVISLIFDFAFNELGMLNMTATPNANNIKGVFNLLRVGMEKHGVRPKWLMLEGNLVDQIVFGMSSKSWKNTKE